MPLVERYTDWDVPKPSLYDDPRNLDFDHRVEAVTAELKPLVTAGDLSANVESNVRATCLITILDKDFGWAQNGSNWVYTPGIPGSGAVSATNRLSRAYEVPIGGNNFFDDQKKMIEDALTDPGDPKRNLTLTSQGQAALAKVRNLVWPLTTQNPTYKTRFDLSKQYYAGSSHSTGYHIGNGYIGTAGHCVAKELLSNKLATLRVVFNWAGNLDGKSFSPSEIFEIESVQLCDAPGQYTPGSVDAVVAQWARRWDTAIFKLKGDPAALSKLEKVTMAAEPPRFGTPIYNVGAPLGTAFKISPKAHVLRHSLFEGSNDAFAHAISGYGTYTTDLDQFGGNSGGPVFDANTGRVYGHTVSTQDEVAGGSLQEQKAWEDEFVSQSSNYRDCAFINTELQTREPTDEYYRIYPKWLRVFKPDSPTVSIITHVCPGDWGPNKPLGAPATHPTEKTHSVVLNRHRFNTRDVYFRNVSGRVDRNSIFMTPINKLIADFADCKLKIKISGTPGFRRPSPISAIRLTINGAKWSFPLGTAAKDPATTNACNVFSKTISLKEIVQKQPLPATTATSPPGLLAWTQIQFEQPFNNPLQAIGLCFTVRRAGFRFPANASWPPKLPAVTGDKSLQWPEEEFHFATTVGDSDSKSRTDLGLGSSTFSQNFNNWWTWTADLDRVWTNPKQPSHGMGAKQSQTLLNEFMSDIDPKLA